MLFSPRVVLILAAGVFATLPTVRRDSAQSDLPFARYSAPDSFRGRPADVDLASDSAARRFRTVLRQGARAGPNFGGSYTIVTWGCGTNCRQLAVISARTGAVYFAPFTVESEVHYRRTSQLLVVDPYACSFAEAERPGPRWRQLYLWDGRRLTALDSLRVRPGSTC